ncbi:MAG: MOP flippase family protein [Giesbergeria sp.]|nr:MOP flippase family protein [Giesbergeria sp.]
MTLKHKTFSAVRWTTAATGVRALLQIAQVAVLARLLAPADYGLMAMVSVVLGFASIFADMGMNSAYVQRQNVSEQERSSLFWLNVGMSGALTLVVLVLSPLLARWFGDVRLTPLLMLAASTFVISALGQQVRMSAEKAMNFRPVVLLEVVAALLGFAAAVAGALAGWGVYALLVGGIVSAVSGTLLAWLYLADGWRPLWRFKLADVRGYMGFGGALVANNLVNEVNRGIDLLLGGRMLGAAALGLYSMPRQIVFQIQGMVNPIITRVGFPLIAQVQTDIPRVRAIYLKTLNMTAATNAPLYVGIAFFAPEVVRIVLGDKWLEAADLLRLLAILGFIRSTGNPVGSLLLGMGRADLSLKWNLAMLLVVPPMLWVCSQYGTMGLAWGLLGLQVALFVPGWYVMVRPVCKAGLWEYSVAALRPFFLAGGAFGVGYFAGSLVNDIYLRLGIAMVSAVPLYLWLSFLLNREWVLAMMHLAGRQRVLVP